MFTDGNKNALPQGRQGADTGTGSVQMTDNLRSNGELFKFQTLTYTQITCILHIF